MTRIAALASSGATFWMPPQASNFARGVDFVFYFILWLSAAFFVLIVGLMFLFIWRYRRRAENESVAHISHNNSLELLWTIIPTILLVPMFWWGFVGFVDARTPPDNTYDINVIAKKWSWQFVYPNGYDDNHLHVPADVPVKLIMRSEDVIHSCFIPAFRVKRDVVPGRYSFLWFTAFYHPERARTAGAPIEYPLSCAEYCGTQHSDMRATVYVHPDRSAFDDWLANADPFSEKNMTPEQYADYLRDPAAYAARHPELKDKLLPPVERGRMLYRKKGCFQCHSLDGSAGQGPTWKGVWGKTEMLRGGGSVVVDENYVRESIMNPGAVIVAGFDNVMPKVLMNEREMDAIIAFMKSLKE